MPIGMPGWPDFAASTASIASIRIAFASRRRGGRAEAGSWALLSAIDAFRSAQDDDASGLVTEARLRGDVERKRGRIVAHSRRAAQPRRKRGHSAFHGGGLREAARRGREKRNVPFSAPTGPPICE